MFRLPTIYGTHSFLESYTNAVGVNRAELSGAPRLGLQWTVGKYLASALLVFGIHGLNTFYGESHHGLVADPPRERLVIHPGDVQVSVAAVDACIGWRSAIAKGFLETANLGPPMQRLRGIGGRQNGDSAFDDRFHGRSIRRVEPSCLSSRLGIQPRKGQPPGRAFIGTNHHFGEEPSLIVIKVIWTSATMVELRYAPQLIPGAQAYRRAPQP